MRRRRGPHGHDRGVRHRRGPRRPGITARAAGGAVRAGHRCAAARGTTGRDPQGKDKRAEPRRDWAEDVIDKEDWLDIKQRSDDRIARARKEYDWLTGTATVFGDIPRPTRCATHGRTGTPIDAAPPSRPSSARSPSAPTPPAVGEHGSARSGSTPCASEANSTGDPESSSPDASAIHTGSEQAFRVATTVALTWEHW